MIERIFVLALRFAVLGVVLPAFTQAPGARADSASCLAKATSFVAELDELLEKEKEWDTPYPDLIKRYFPLRDCEAQALLDVCSQSRFIRSIRHNPRTNEYFIRFERGNLGAWFAYLVAERKSNTSDAGFMRKP
jgi:hypothetical protein